MAKFCRYELRTTDAAAARAFYARVLGHDRAVIWPLHEQALARGARPHWLGHLGVEDVERTARAFVERGASLLAPTRPAPNGGHAAVLRDPGGALVALASPSASELSTGVEVAFQVLNTNQVERAVVDYQELFGWHIAQQIERTAGVALRHFAWDASGDSVGAFADIATRPGVHAHWLFFFEVDSLDAIMAVTRDAGGLVLDPIVAPSGHRLCVCDDPQGAAFGLRERRSSASAD